MDSDDPEFKEWAARKLAEILSLEEQERLAEESPSEELKKINGVLDYEVMPIMEAFGVPITRDELSKMFVEWFVRRRPSPAHDVQSSHESLGAQGAVGLTPTLIKGKVGSIIRPLFRIFKVNTFGSLLRRVLKGILIVAMLVPIVLLPAYFFLSTLAAPPLILNPVPISSLLSRNSSQSSATSQIVSTTSTAVPPPVTTCTTSTSTVAPASSTTITVSMVLGAGFNTSIDKAYSPDPVIVVAGVNSTITWVNNDCAPHTVTANDASFDSGNVAPGQSFTFTFTTPGTYQYYCAYHPWMTGTVEVKGG